MKSISVVTKEEIKCPDCGSYKVYEEMKTAPDLFEYKCDNCGLEFEVSVFGLFGGNTF